ncbi:MAG: helix-turn-helix transcriptional regulator [Methylobacter sp.]
MSLLKLKDVIEKVKLSRSSIYSLTKAGAFPPPLRLSERRIAWRTEDVDNWLNNRPVAQNKKDDEHVELGRISGLPLI